MENCRRYVLVKAPLSSSPCVARAQILYKEPKSISKYSSVEFVFGHQASSPANRALPGRYLFNKDEDAKNILSYLTRYSSPTPLSSHFKSSGSGATEKQIR